MRKLKDQELLSRSPLFQTDDLRIDRMMVDDLDEVTQIEVASFPAPWSRSYFLYEIRRNPVAYPIVLRRETTQDLLGFAICWLLPEEVHITNVAVRPQNRNQGYGALLIHTIMELGKTYGCPRAVLEVRISNRNAIRLYTNLGFRVAGIAPHYYDNNGEDAYILRREL